MPPASSRIRVVVQPRAAIIGLCIVAGAAIAALLLPTAFRRLPNDMARTGRLLDAFRTPNGAAPRTIVLGNSIVMNGIDARRLSTPESLAWNAATPGQAPIETLLLLDALPEATRDVVVGLAPDVLRDHKFSLDGTRYVAFVVGRYQRSPLMDSLVTSVADSESRRLWDEPGWRIVLDGRWVVRSSIDTWVRGLLRSDLSLDRALTDLQFPVSYSNAIAPEVVEQLIRATFVPRPSFALSPAASALLNAMKTLAVRRGRRLTIVLMPEHPRKRDYSTPQYYTDFARTLDSLRGQGFSILDYHDLLPATQFIDQIHPDTVGAEFLTAHLRATLHPTR